MKKCPLLIIVVLMTALLLSACVDERPAGGSSGTVKPATTGLSETPTAQAGDIATVTPGGQETASLEPAPTDDAAATPDVDAESQQAIDDLNEALKELDEAIDDADAIIDELENLE